MKKKKSRGTIIFGLQFLRNKLKIDFCALKSFEKKLAKILLLLRQETAFEASFFGTLKKKKNRVRFDFFLIRSINTCLKKAFYDFILHVLFISILRLIFVVYEKETFIAKKN